MSYMYRSRTQMHLEKIKQEALAVREQGISATRGAIEKESAEGNREFTRHLIATMNYSVPQVQKELRNRRKK